MFLNIQINVINEVACILNWTCITVLLYDPTTAVKRENGKIKINK